MLTNYFEEIRREKFSYDLMIKEIIDKNIINTYNNTLTNWNLLKNNSSLNIDIDIDTDIDNGNTNMDLDLNKGEIADDLNPFKIFNKVSLRNLGIVNRFIIKPTYEAMKNEFENIFNNSIKLFKIIYIIILSIFLSLIFICYLFLWKPFETNLNSKVI